MEERHTIESLTSKQRAKLRTLAHRLKPVVQIGNDGLTAAVVAAVEDALKTRELLKVKVQEGAPIGSTEAATALASRIEGAHVPQVIGRTIVLYRPFAKNPEIRLPS